MWCVDMVRELISSDAAAREEKSITEVSRDIIPAIDFLDALKRKRKKGLLSIEFKVSSVFYFYFFLTESHWWSFFQIWSLKPVSSYFTHHSEVKLN